VSGRAGAKSARARPPLMLRRFASAGPPAWLFGYDVEWDPAPVTTGVR